MGERVVRVDRDRRDWCPVGRPATTWPGLGGGQRYEWYATASDGTSSTTAATRSFTTSAGGDPVLVGAGDIATCLNPGNTGTETAAVLTGVLGDVFTAGDDAYQNGTLAEFTNCYDPSWGGPGGSIKSRTHPAAGNHEWNTGNLNGYFAYFGAQAGGNSYYSYDLGTAWHVVVLDSECAKVAGGCGSTSAQLTWLRSDLTTNAAKNVIAVFHKPRFTSGGTPTTEVQPFWDVLYQFHADLILGRTRPCLRAVRADERTGRVRSDERDPPDSSWGPAARATRRSGPPCRRARSATRRRSAS